jgi:hypothetical protein
MTNNNGDINIIILCQYLVFANLYVCLVNAANQYTIVRRPVGPFQLNEFTISTSSSFLRQKGWMMSTELVWTEGLPTNRPVNTWCTKYRTVAQHTLISCTFLGTRMFKAPWTIQICLLQIKMFFKHFIYQ